MEVSVIGKNICRAELGNREVKFSSVKSSFDTKVLFSKKNRVCFDAKSSIWRRHGVRFALKAIRSESVRCDDEKPSRTSTAKFNSLDRVRLFVGLPLDSVSDCNSVRHIRAIAAGLKALKLLGVEGVELPIWWGVVEKEAMGTYEWSGYLTIADMIRKAGLKLHVSLCFHASNEPRIPLPQWVTQIGESQPDIYYMDKSGQRYKDCLSLAVDELPVFNGKSPIQVYSGFCESFKSSFSDFLGSTITGITMSLGPDGELRYPSHHQPSSSGKMPRGVGEFQCYDKNMLTSLKEKAEGTGNPLWGLAGPHDTPTYNQSLDSNNFFKDNGSWESTYGEFFLSWYSSQLVSHANRILSVGSSTFRETAVTVHGKVPLMHAWYKTRSHPSELTAGFYNTVHRNGYESVANIFANNSCKMILPGMDLSGEQPELLLSQVLATCKKHGVEVFGQNTNSSVSGGFEQIKKNLSDENVGDLFTYHRMGAYFFSPEHFPSFSEFVRSLKQLDLHADDLPTNEEDLCLVPDTDVQNQMQTV